MAPYYIIIIIQSSAIAEKTFTREEYDVIYGQPLKNLIANYCEQKFWSLLRDLSLPEVASSKFAQLGYVFKFKRKPCRKNSYGFKNLEKLGAVCSETNRILGAMFYQ